jgi:hypothetical protein
MLLGAHHDAAPAYHLTMRTTVVLDSDVAAEIDRLRRQGIGVSEALNLLARRGMATPREAKEGKYQHRTSKVGIKVDVTNIAEVLDLLDDDSRRDAVVGARPTGGGGSDEQERRS